MAIKEAAGSARVEKSTKKLVHPKRSTAVRPAGASARGNISRQVPSPLGQDIDRHGKVQDLARQERAEKIRAVMQKASGVDFGRFAEMLVGQCSKLESSAWATSDSALVIALESLFALGPRNATEALLCVQMLAVHFAATASLCTAAEQGHSIEVCEIYMSRATRLMRLFAQQAELLGKLQGITVQQRVSVEHVHVNAGGKAIVGLIGRQRPGGGSDE
jgi:hypothetical protein